MDISHVARSVKEGAEDNLCGVSKGEESTDTGNDQKDYLARAANRGVLKRGKHSFLGHKAQKRWHRSHRGCTNYYGTEGPRHLIPQRSKAANIARPSLVVDDANEHKQRGLKQRVRQSVDQRCGDSERGAHTDGGNNPAQMGDGGIGRKLLQIRLLHCKYRGHHRGAHAYDDEQPIPHRHIVEDGGKANKQVHTGLDHRCCVKEGRYRGGGGHSLWQPEMEWELCRLSKGRRRNQHGYGCRYPWAFRPYRGRQDGRYGSRSGHRRGNTQAGQQGQSANKGQD